jgi:4-diphosphocytidyl-2-C-methyl-D-erythritol kinase
MVLFPNAKINLGLFITDRLPSGFHHLQSIFLPINWCDGLEFSRMEQEDAMFYSSGNKIEGNVHENLVVKAMNLFMLKTGLSEVPKMHLIKSIPSGDGIGGGSSDAAFVLKGLNEWFNAQIEKETLKHWASELGSDCPFFIDNVPSYLDGVGKELIPIENFQFPFYILVVFPELHIPTALAFRQVVPNPDRKNLLETFNSIDFNDWQKYLVNDFQAGLELKFPEISAVLDGLKSQGAFFSSLSGSGSAIYGLFEKFPEEACFEIKRQFPNYRVRMCSLVEATSLTEE